MADRLFLAMALCIAVAGGIYSVVAHSNTRGDLARVEIEAEQSARQLEELQDTVTRLLEERDPRRGVILEAVPNEESVTLVGSAMSDAASDGGGETASGSSDAPSPLPQLLFDRVADMLASGDRERRERLLRDLELFARFGDERARELIVRSLSDADPEVREQAVESLASVREPALAKELAVLLDDPERDVRREVANALEDLPGERSSQLLRNMLSDVDDGVVRKVVQVLSKRDDITAIPGIAALISSENSSLVAEAGAALRRLGDDIRADRALRRLALDLSNNDAGERTRTVRRIATVGGPLAIPYLEQALEDSNKRVQREAGRQIEKLRKLAR